MAKGTCWACERQEVGVKERQGIKLCATCINIAGQVKNHRQCVIKLDNHLHGAELVASKDSSLAAVEQDYLLEVVAEVNDALGGGYNPGELAVAVQKLVKGTAARPVEIDKGVACAKCAHPAALEAVNLTMEALGGHWKKGALRELPEVVGGLVQRVAELEALRKDDGDLCNPASCDELRGALKALLDVQHALGGYAASAPAQGDLATVVAELVQNLEMMKRQGQDIDIGRLVDEDRYLVPDGYEALMAVFVAAMDQAANGKGKERHATPVPFPQQASCRDARDLGIAFPVGQAVKKARECMRLGGRARRAEILGAIVYLAIAHIVDGETVRGERYVPAPPELALSFAEGGGHD